MALAAPAMSLPRDSTRSLPCGTRCEAVSRGMPGHSADRPPRSPCGSKNRYVLHNDRRRECPTGPHRLAHSPRTGSSAFGGELPARPDLRERISGTQQPTGVTGELFSTAFRWSSAWHSRDTARISNHYVHTLSKIDPQSEQLDGIESLRSIRSRNNWTVSSYQCAYSTQMKCIFHSGTGINCGWQYSHEQVKIGNGVGD